MYDAPNRLAKLQARGRCALMVVTMIVALTVALPLAIALKGVVGAWAAVAAAATVLASSIVSLLVADIFRGPAEALWGLLFSMALRMSPPMAACLLVLLQNGSLASGGFVLFVLAFYLVALPLETLLAISKVKQGSQT